MSVQMSLMEYYALIGTPFELKITPASPGTTETTFTFDTSDYDGATTPLLDFAFVITAMAFVVGAGSTIDYVKFDSIGANAPAFINANSFPCDADGVATGGRFLTTGYSIFLDGMHQYPNISGTRVHPTLESYCGRKFVIARNIIAVRCSAWTTTGETFFACSGLRIPREQIMPADILPT